MNKTIDYTAPLSARKEIIIDAPIEKVWEVLTNLAGWPQWQPDITTVKLDGAVAVGSVFRWKASGLNITSTLHTVESDHKIGWTGVSLGMFAIHNWTFEKNGKGTRVTTEESLSGWLTRMLKLFDPKFLEKSLEGSLMRLKMQVEN
jgi:uncharacterized protein YndB with AHSA1/START domain